MSNHFHLVAVPAHDDAAAKVLGRLESDYARFINVRRRTSGHLWQARYHSVAMEPPHCWRMEAKTRLHGWNFRRQLSAASR
jgi:putative transposase